MTAFDPLHADGSPGGGAAPSLGIAPPIPTRPEYLQVFLTFARNSLVRDMTFRANFLIETFSAICWMMMNLGFYVLVFRYTPSLGAGTGWGKYEFLVFYATTTLINSFIEAFFMNNAE